MENINNTYFDGYYKDIWRTVIPGELTTKEADFIVQYFNLKTGDPVLDLMCGYGRHSVALARKGMYMTAVDNLSDYIDEIKVTTKSESLPVRAIKSDILEYQPEGFFELAICMGNSLNFLNKEDTLKLLSTIHASLKEGGSILINTWSLAEIAIKQFAPKSWSIINDLKYLSDSRYLFHPTRIETETTIIADGKVTETKTSVDYIFSVAEMETILNQAGFTLREIFSIPGRKKFTLGDPRAYIVADKT